MNKYLFWFAMYIAGFAILLGVVYVIRGLTLVNRPTPEVIGVCAIPSVRHLAADLVHGYVVKTATPMNQFVLTNANVCNVYFYFAAATPDAVIARDALVVIVNRRNRLARISAIQLSEIFSGSIHDWSQLGQTHAAIVPILPDSDTDEGKLLVSSLLYGATLGHGVRSVRSSADVTRIVERADRTGRDAIGLSTLSHCDGTKVVPITELPALDSSSIVSHRYPYALNLAIGAGHAPGVIARSFVDYARSAAGTAIVVKEGLIPRNGWQLALHRCGLDHRVRHRVRK